MNPVTIKLLQPNHDNFPSGVAAMGDYLHKLGLKYDIFTWPFCKPSWVLLKNDKKMSGLVSMRTMAITLVVATQESFRYKFNDFQKRRRDASYKAFNPIKERKWGRLMKFQNMERDAKQFADWGVDYVKVRWFLKTISASLSYTIFSSPPLFSTQIEIYKQAN